MATKAKTATKKRATKRTKKSEKITLDNITSQIEYFLNFNNGLAEDVAKETRNRLILAFPLALIISAIAIALNLGGFPRVNLVIAICITFLCWAAEAKNLLKYWAAGIFISKVGNIVNLVVNFTGKSLIWVIFTLVFAGTMPLEYGLYGIPALAACLLLMVLMDFFWHMELKWAKRLAHGYALVVVVTCFSLFVPPTLYIQTIGFYPYQFLENLKFNSKIYTLNKMNRANQEKRRLGFLALLEEELKSGKTYDELVVNKNGQRVKATEVMENYEKEITNGSIVGKISGLFTKEPPTSDTIGLASGVYNFQLNPGQTNDKWVTVQDGCQYSFSSSTANDPAKQWFFLVYKDGKMVKVDRPDVTIPPGPGPFKLMGGENGAYVKLLIVKTT